MPPSLSLSPPPPSTRPSRPTWSPRPVSSATRSATPSTTFPASTLTPRPRPTPPHLLFISSFFGGRDSGQRLFGRETRPKFGSCPSHHRGAPFARAPVSGNQTLALRY